MNKKNSMVIVSQMFKALILAQIVANITPSLANISNGLLIGNSLSPTAMAALSFVAPTGGLFAAIAAVISLGGNIMCGNCMGRGENDKINGIFTTVMFTIVTIGVVLTIIAEIFTGSVAAMLGAEGDALPDTIAYLKGLCIGILPTLMVPCLVVFLNMANEIMYAMMSTIVLAVVNLSVGVINLHVLGGNMFGMGLASAISEYAALVFLLLRFVKKKNLTRIQTSGFRLPYVWKIVILGSPSALMYFLYSIRNIQINSLSYETGGTAAVTALGILSSSAGIFDAVNTGIGATLVMLASVMAGEGDRESLKNLTRYTMTFGAVLVVLKTGVFAALAKPIALLFGATGSDISLAMGCVFCYAACMPFNLLPTMALKIYQCLNRITLTNIMYALTCIVFPIGIMRILGPKFGIYGVWSAYSLTEVLTILVLFAVCWVMSRHFPKTAGDWLWLKKTFPISEEATYSVSVCDTLEIGRAVDGLEQFLHNLGVMQAYRDFCVQYTQNMIISIMVDNRSAAQYVKCAVDVFVTVDGDDVMIRLRDNYAPYDRTKEEFPEALDKLLSAIPDRKVQREWAYQSTFGMNVLTLKCGCHTF